MSEIQAQENVILAPMTTLKIGGAARFFVEAKTETEVTGAIKFAANNNLPVFVLGEGSNILISDKGFDGLVLKIALKGVEVFQEKTEVFVIAQAGEDWDEFVQFCVEKNLAGIECLSGIPGTIGASPVQNIGAYGQEVAETIVSVRVLERESGKIFELTNADCGFAYRTSIFNTVAREKFIVLNVTFGFKLNGKPVLRYADLQKFFAERKEEPSLIEVRNAVLQIRAAKSMVIRHDDPNSRSAGSFFKNPIVSPEKLAEIEVTAQKLNLIESNKQVPHFPVDENHVKLAAAWLIEKSGFHKGFVKGRAGLSSRHTLAIVNRGDATAADITELMQTIQRRVAEVFGVALNPEPVFIGFE